MKIILTPFAATVILAFSFSYEAMPQLRIDLNSNNYYDDNIYNNYYKVEDFINSITLGSGYNFEGETNNFQVYYIGSYYYYQKNNLKTNYSHKVGLVNTKLLSVEGNPLNAGVNLIFRKNRDYFSIYDFRQISGYTNYSYSFTQGINLVLGYLFSRNDFFNLSYFSYYENKAFVRTAFSFETRTSVMLGSEVNFKHYIEKSVDPSITDKNSQLTFYLNAAQSLSENTGLAVHALGRLNLKDGTRYIGDDTYIYYEEEIINTLYSSEGMEYGLNFTQLIGNYLTLGIEASYKTRHYSNLPVADINGNSLDIYRKDKEYSFGIGLQYDLFNLIDGLGLVLNYNYIKNRSNDYFYDFDNQLILIGFDWSY
ncbi:MAG: surface lipoprotein assembly modifier [Ignavibacteria bacterium]